MPSKRKPTNNTASSTPFVFNYAKPETRKLINDFSEEPLSLSEGQVYSPINEVFFQLNDSNAYTATLNYNLVARSILEVDCGGCEMGSDDESESDHASTTSQNGDNEDNEVPQYVGGFATVMCEDPAGGSVEKRAFIKFSPLLDPIGVPRRQIRYQ